MNGSLGTGNCTAMMEAPSPGTPGHGESGLFPPATDAED